MPELPEVECLARAMDSVCRGSALTNAKFYRDTLRDKIPVEAFKRALEGKVVNRIERRSKYLLWEADGATGVFHLGMTGNLMRMASENPEVPHTHAVFSLRSSQGPLFLHFVDPRRFGRISVISATENIDNHPYFRDLGPEPLVHQNLGGHFFRESRKSVRPIKNFLMDSSIVVGVGNIYASEALFRAKISPLRLAGSVSFKEYQKLASEVQLTLRLAIEAGGTTFRDYKDLGGSPGYFKVSLNVYGRSRETCVLCKNKILTIRQAGRSTFYCANCQK